MYSSLPVDRTALRISKYSLDLRKRSLLLRSKINRMFNRIEYSIIFINEISDIDLTLYR